MRFNKEINVLKALLNKLNDKNKKGNRQVKKVITVNPSEKDFIVANLDSIDIKLRPEKYNPIEKTASNPNLSNVFFDIFGGIIS